MSQSQWKDYVTQPPPYPHYTHDSYEQEDPKGWGGGGSKGWGSGGSVSHRHTYDRHARSHTASLPRGGPGAHHPPPPQAYPMGYSSYDRRAAGGGFAARPAGPADYPPDHYFMPSQRKYSGEVLRVYVDYNK